jgi:hypothetical protein
VHCAPPFLIVIGLLKLTCIGPFASIHRYSSPGDTLSLLFISQPPLLLLCRSSLFPAPLLFPSILGPHNNVQSNGGIGFPACAIPEVIPLKLKVHFDCDLVSVPSFSSIQVAKSSQFKVTSRTGSHVSQRLVTVNKFFVEQPFIQLFEPRPLIAVGSRNPAKISG